MSWEQLRNKNERNTAKAILKYLGLEDIEVELLKPWEDHEEIVESAESTGQPTAELSNLDKLKIITDDIIDDLYTGRLEVEDGQELLATVRAAKALGMLADLED